MNKDISQVTIGTFFGVFYSGTPLIRPPLGPPKKLAVLKTGFFTRKCMAVFARKPKTSGHNNEVAVRRSSTVQKMIGWVALRFVIALCWSLNRLECDDQFLFLSYFNSCSACEMSFLSGKECPGKCAHIVHHQVKKKFMYIYSLGQLERL